MVAPPMPDDVTHPLHVVRQAALIGGAAAVPGTIVGAFAGTLRTSTPILFSLASGAQWFAIGTTFYTVRTSILNHCGLHNWWNITRGAPLIPRTDLSPTLKDKVRASSISGAVTGASLGYLFRGPKNVLPGTIMFTLFGFAGQHVYDFLDKRNSEALKQEAKMKQEGKVKESWLDRAAKSKWSPMSKLSDEEYVHMLEERVLSVEAEIALIDERIEGFRKKQRESETGQRQESKNQEKK